MATNVKDKPVASDLASAAAESNANKLVLSGSDLIETEARELLSRASRLHSFWKKSAIASAITAALGLAAFLIKSVVYGLPTEIRSIHIPDEILFKFSDAVIPRGGAMGNMADAFDSMGSQLAGMIGTIFPILGLLVTVGAIYGLYRSHAEDRDRSSSVAQLFIGISFFGGATVLSSVMGVDDDIEDRETERIEFVKAVESFDEIHSDHEIKAIGEIIKSVTQKGSSTDAVSYLIAQMLLKRKKEQGLTSDSSSVLVKNVDVLLNTTKWSFSPDIKTLYLLESSASPRISKNAKIFVEDVKSFVEEQQAAGLVYQAAGRVSMGITWLLLGAGCVCYLLSRSMRKRVTAVEKYLPYSLTRTPLPDNSPLKAHTYDDKPWEGK